MTSPSTQAASPTSPCDSEAPRPLSLYRILRLYPRERLLVYPLQWTSRHVQLLECSFDQALPAARQHGHHEHPEGERKAAGFTRRFVSAYSPGFRRTLIDKIFASGQNSPLVSLDDGINFYYSGRALRRLPCHCFVLRTETATYQVPVAAWTETLLIQEYRYESIRVGSGRRPNPPVHDLRRRRMKALTPAEPLHDPYILALLIAVARGQRVALEINEGHMEMLLFRSHVILTDHENQDHAHLFTADIPSAFLDRFDFPDHDPPAPVPISIRHITVPYKPHKLFYPRLLDLILPDWYVNTRSENSKEENNGGELPKTDEVSRQDGTDEATYGRYGPV